MVNVEPSIPDTGHYSLGETATLLGIHRNSLRNYANVRMIKFSISRFNGRKYFTGREIKRFWRTCF